MQISKEKILEFYAMSKGDKDVFEALLSAYQDGQNMAVPDVTVTPFVPYPVYPAVPTYEPWRITFGEPPMLPEPTWWITC